MDSTVYRHTYTKNGLLDSTIEIWYHFRDGIQDLSLTTLIGREYNEKGLLKEVRTYNYSEEKRTKQLKARNTKEYDIRGNLILNVELEVDGSKSKLSTLSKSSYNSNNQEVVRFGIREDFLHKGHYDTLITSYTYDREGHVVTETYGNPEQQDRSMSTTAYANGMKVATYITKKNGDTTVVYNYTQEGDLVRKTPRYIHEADPRFLDTVWYHGDKVVKSVNLLIDSHQKMMKRRKYDAKGNKIIELNYK